VATAEQAGIAHRVELVPSLLYDVDTPDDLAAVAAQLAGRRGSAPLTRGALRQLDRSGACGSSTSNQRPPRERDAAARNVRVITT
jgi:2-phospho-L-lactate guanylyltransferase (CobY/MobA/RfbA family)